jgi:NAD(P)-dependent dehydrogenase (short-subunit alcohol dehydrogenase family)
MGLATAQLLASQGATISLADINQDLLKAAVDSLPNSDSHLATIVDVRNSDSVNSWIEETVKKFGKLDGAVNMAGIIQKPTPITEVSDKDWDTMFNVNTKGVFNCLRAQLRAMAPGASIVNLTNSRLFAQYIDL